MSDPFVKISNLSKQFKKGRPLALKGIDVEIGQGQLIGLAGPDGSGKTTLIRLIAGLLKPSEGRITVAGFDTLNDAIKLHQITRYMPQRFALYEDLTVEQNLTLYADLTGVVGPEREVTFDKLLSFTTLRPFMGRLAGQLSGGMKQKLGLACALVCKPTLLLLDEPSVGVDPISRRELWQMVRQLLDEGITVLWSTAYLDEAERCDSVLLLNQGQLLYSGPPSAMRDRVAGRTFQINLEKGRRHLLLKLMQQANILDGTVEGGGVRILVRDPAILPPGSNPTPPRFEDAFIDILGGWEMRHSLLAQEREVVEVEEAEIVQAKGLTKKFGEFVAVNHVSFTVKRGEIFGLLGPNGAGKSTIFKMMCGLLKPTEGEAYINGLELQKASGKARAQIGHMAQKFSLYGNLSTRQNLDFFSRIYNLQGRERRAAVDRMVEIFDLAPYLDEVADELPLGFKQRLSLACATIHAPPILFLDEPTSGVDPITRREFWLHIVSLVEKGITVIVTSHFMDEAEFCDRIGLVFQAELIELGTPQELKEKAGVATLEEAFIQLIERRNG